MDMSIPRPIAAIGTLVLVLASVWAFTGGTATESAAPGVRVSPNGVYNPVTAGEPLPDGFRQLLPRDAIKPVYEPTFVAADEVPWRPEVQVIGVSLGDEARAYPVSFLNGREMVIDEIDGIPILVTW